MVAQDAQEGWGSTQGKSLPQELWKSLEKLKIEVGKLALSSSTALPGIF